MIENYQFGTMTINGKKYLNDLKIIGGHVISNWWRRESHSVEVADVEDILAAKPDILVVGTGNPGRMQVNDSLRAVLADEHIMLIEEPTASALQTLNHLHGQGKKVAGVFHLTC